MPPSSADDSCDEGLAEAIRRTRAGDLEAYGEVVRLCDAALRRYLASRTPTLIDGEEIIQRTFIAAYDRLASYQSERPFLAWIQGIARNELLHELRRERRWARLQARAGERALSDRLVQRLDAASGELDDQLAALERCLERLAAPARELVDLRYRHDWTVEAIAGRLRRPAGTIRRQLFSLRQRLLTCVKRGTA